MMPTGVPGDRSWPDQGWLAGATLETVQLGPLSQILQADRHEYMVRTTLAGGFDPTNYPAWVGETELTQYEPASAGAFRQKRTTTAYDTTQLLPRPTEVIEEGWLDPAGQPDANTLRRCTATAYATDQAANMLVYPASVTVHDGDCGTGAIVAASETYYDNQATLGALGAGVNRRALPTRQRVRVDETTWVDSAQMTYDGFHVSAR